MTPRGAGVEVLAAEGDRPPWGDDPIVSLLVPAPGEASILSWLALVVAACYIVGLLRERHASTRTPVWRAAAFLLGCVLLWATTGTALEPAGATYFSVFMFQQLTLMILVPSLLVLGSPGRLLLRAVPHRGAGALVLRAALGALRSRAASAALHPVLGVGLFLLAYYGLYLTGAADPLLRSAPGHAALEIAFLLSGLLFALPVLSSDPLPRRVTHAERVLDVFVEMALHAFFGVLIMIRTTPLVPVLAEATAAAGGSPIADQAIAGGLAWSYGEGPAVLTLLLVLHRWYRADTAAAARADARIPPGAISAELEAYNAHLARLAALDVAATDHQRRTRQRARADAPLEEPR